MPYTEAFKYTLLHLYIVAMSSMINIHSFLNTYLHQLSAVCIMPSSGGFNVKMSNTQPVLVLNKLKFHTRAQVPDNILGYQRLVLQSWGKSGSYT